MYLYTVRDEYIDYLIKNTDEKNIRYNKNEKRPYIGILFTVNEYDYFAPLSHPQEKHKKMNETIDFIKLENGQLGVINLNNMMPVPKFCLKLIDVECQEEKYRNLLLNQIYEISRKEKIIKRKSFILYNIVLSGELKHEKLINRCNNFEILEEKALKYEIIEKEKTESIDNIQENSINKICIDVPNINKINNSNIDDERIR